MRQILTRLLKRPAATPADVVHFHGGITGPFVCENPHCTSPHLSERDL